MLVEIYVGNYDSQDSLINGVVLIINAYRKSNTFEVVRTNFDDPTIK